MNGLLTRFNSYVMGRLLRHLPDRRLVEQVRQDLANTQVGQRALFFQYQALCRQGGPLPRFADTGFRVYSQADEDGLLLYVFALIGFSSRVCVDFGSASPYGANSTNLLCNWGFTGCL